MRPICGQAAVPHRRPAAATSRRRDPFSNGIADFRIDSRLFRSEIEREAVQPQSAVEAVVVPECCGSETSEMRDNLNSYDRRLLTAHTCSIALPCRHSASVAAGSSSGESTKSIVLCLLCLVFDPRSYLPSSQRCCCCALAAGDH